MLARRRAYEVARKASWSDNTWGAYQCYGDPDFRLRSPRSPRGSGNGNFSFVAVSEAIDAAQRVRDDLNIALERKLDRSNERPDDGPGERLKKIEAAAEKRMWMGRAELRVALAEAWGELGELPKAIAHYAAAVGGPDTSFKVKAIEQLTNLSARHAVAVMRSLPPEQRNSAKTAEEIRTWLRKIEGLTALLGETRERLSLQGSCWKRLAQVRPAVGEAEAALKTMAECYDRAAAIDERGNKSYPLLMACSARICDAVRAGKDCDASVEAQLKTLIGAEPPDDADFWDLILRADARTAEVVLRSPNPSAELPALEKGYRRAWCHMGSPVKLRSVLEQLDFYEDIFSFGAPGTEFKRASIQALARNLRNTLEASFLIARKIDPDLTSTDTQRSPTRSGATPDLAETEAALTSEAGPR